MKTIVVSAFCLSAFLLFGSAVYLIDKQPDKWGWFLGVGLVCMLGAAAFTHEMKD